MANFFKNIFTKNAKSPPVQSGPDRQTRQQEMLAQLERIDLSASHHRLSQEVIRELDLAEAIRFAHERLSSDKCTGPDSHILDTHLSFFISALVDAIGFGFETTAQLARSAMIYTIVHLRTDISPVDIPQTQELMASREEYAENLKLLVELSREQEQLSRTQKELTLRREQQQNELDRCRADLEARRDSGVQDLRPQTDRLQVLEASLEKLSRDIETTEENLFTRQSQMESRRNALAMPPYVYNSTLPVRCDIANRRTQEKVRRKLDTVDAYKQTHDEHTRNLFNLFSDSRRPAAPVSTPPKSRTPASWSSPDRQTQQQMLARVQSIDLNAPANKLPAESIQELDIAGVLRLACDRLSAGEGTGPNLPDLDRNITYFIDALDDALRKDYPLAAEYSCAALVFALKNLRIDIPDADRGQAHELMAQRVEYSENLKLLVELYREKDHSCKNLEALDRREQYHQSMFISAESAYLRRKDAGALDAPLAELQTAARDGSLLSYEALQLRRELASLKLHKDVLKEIDIFTNAERAYLTVLDQQIENMHNMLANPPHAGGPRLRERFQEAELRYVQQLLSAAKSDDRNELMAQNHLLRNRVKSLRTQLAAAQEQAQLVPQLKLQIQSLQETIVDKPHPERLRFEALLDIDDL